MMLKLHSIVASLALLSLAPAHAVMLNDPNPTVQRHLDAAAKLAGADLDYLYQFRCRAPRGRDVVNAPAPAPKIAPPPPTRVFDNLYFVGGADVMGWALKTSAGIILFDALNNPEEARTQIIDGLVKLGLDPKDVKYIVVMHGHGDHWGGAQYLKDTLGAPILMSAADWQFTEGYVTGATREGPPEWKALAPKHDRDITDGQVLTLGDTSVTFYITPGHTPGTVSVIFKTSAHGKPHSVGFWGGTGYPADRAALGQYLSSLDRFMRLSTAAGVDALISNHTHTDNSLEHMEALRTNPNGPNPFVLGEQGVARFFGVLKECGLAQEARR